jgi:hypothetical protein
VVGNDSFTAQYAKAAGGRSVFSLASAPSGAGSLSQLNIIAATSGYTIEGANVGGATDKALTLSFPAGLTITRAAGQPVSSWGPDGSLAIGGTMLFIGTPAANNFVIAQTGTEKYVRYSADNWRLAWIIATGDLRYINNTGAVLFSVQGNGGHVTANGNVKSNGGNGPCMFWDGGNGNYLGMQGGTSPWSFQWDRTNGTLRWIGGSNNELFHVDGGGNMYTTGAARIGGAVYPEGSNTYLYSKGVSVDSFNQSGNTVYANVVGGSPAGMYQCLSLQHSPGEAAQIQLQVGSGAFNFDNNGNAWKTGGAGDWGGISDIRLKENVAPLQYGLAEILALNPITYQMIDRGDYDASLKVGLSAQDARDVMPLMVAEVHNERYGDLNPVLALRTSDFVQYAMVNAIKTLDARLKSLEGA